MYDGVNEYSKFNNIRADQPLELVNMVNDDAIRVQRDNQPRNNLVEFKPRHNLKSISVAPPAGRLTDLELIETDEKQAGYHRLLQVCKDMSERKISRLQEELSVIDEGMRTRLGERFGKGNEWRGLADRNLLRLCQCIDDIETMQA